MSVCAPIEPLLTFSCSHAGKVIVLFYDDFAIRILLAQEAKLVSGVEVAETNALLDGGLALLLPDDVREDYVRAAAVCHECTVMCWY